jgi:hypothetical protein
VENRLRRLSIRAEKNIEPGMDTKGQSKIIFDVGMRFNTHVRISSPLWFVQTASRRTPLLCLSLSAIESKFLYFLLS